MSHSCLPSVSIKKLRQKRRVSLSLFCFIQFREKVHTLLIECLKGLRFSSLAFFADGSLGPLLCLVWCCCPLIYFSIYVLRPPLHSKCLFATQWVLVFVLCNVANKDKTMSGKYFGKEAGLMSSNPKDKYGRKVAQSKKPFAIKAFWGNLPSF